MNSQDIEDKGIVINGLDLKDIVDFISSKNNRYVAIVMQDIEDTIGKDHEKYSMIRKSILGGFNNYTRSVIRALFGVEVEEEHYNK